MATDKVLDTLFREWCGKEAIKTERLTPAGSNREYRRLTSSDDTRAIGVIGNSTDENEAFFTICRHFHSKGLPVPELYGISPDRMSYLQQDLGDISLFDTLEPCRTSGCYDTRSVILLEKVIRILPDLQFIGANGLDFSICYPIESFDWRSILWDLNYFKYYFLKPSGIEFNENILENDFRRIAEILLKDAPYNTFMYRDFQSRNVMLVDGSPFFIDFQGGRRGPIEYDLVSFLWQARAAYPKELKGHLTGIYADSLTRYRQIDTAEFSARLMHFALFRTLQVLGAYGYRGNFERKPHFLASIPAATDNLREIIDSGTGKSEYPYLYSILSALAEQKTENRNGEDPYSGLTVHITSFSFRKGIPEDKSGNGGGFVFDCRSMHNPGLYDEYKQLDGRDSSVISFLDAKGEIQTYMESVYSLTGHAIDKYLSRGFTNLSICFGCTGGRHRSVRCAEMLAAHLHTEYGPKIRILLTHREMKSHKEL